MRCPSCRAPFAEAVAQCPQCNLTLRRLDALFGGVPLHSRFVTDRSASLPLRDIRELRALLNLFHRKFPQSIFSVFIMPRIDGGTIGEYIFWLANRARFGTLEATGAENFEVLLGIDLRARAAALQIGYGLENYLDERDLERALAQSSAGFAADDIPRGVRACVEFMTERMREVVLAAEKRTAEASPAESSASEW
ncbi:MAG: hypothetical protein QOG48_674 [Verrucomicrobiota bacterium]|jgi:uncharacterized membrane protein YgcG